MIAGPLTVSSAQAQAQAQAPAPPRAIDVIEVSGRIDPVIADFVTDALTRAEGADSEVLVIQLDSPGSLLSPDQLDGLVGRLRESSVPVSVWIGPSGSVAYGGAVALVEAAAVAGMASGTTIGKSSSIGDLRGTLNPSDALAQGLVDLSSPTLGDFVVDLDGRQAGNRQLTTSRLVARGQQTAAGDVRFSKLGVLAQLLHTTANPQVAYLLLMLGLFLVVFEFFTAGVGVAGGVGAGALVLAAFGLAVLPTTGLGLALLVIAMAGFAIDVQAGSPRTWTGIAVACLVVGSWRLYNGQVPLPIATVVLVSGGVSLGMISGMTAMLRARFATPTIGRESMVGQMGDAHTGIDPEGTVSLAGGLWRARTNRATPIGKGDRIRVVGLDGLLLEVEPEEGGARDAHH